MPKLVNYHVSCNYFLVLQQGMKMRPLGHLNDIIPMLITYNKHIVETMVWFTVSGLHTANANSN